MVFLNFDDSTGCFKSRDAIEKIEAPCADFDVFKSSEQDGLRCPNDGLGCTLFGSSDVGFGSPKTKLAGFRIDCGAPRSAD